MPLFTLLILMILPLLLKILQIIQMLLITLSILNMNIVVNPSTKNVIKQYKDSISTLSSLPLELPDRICVLDPCQSGKTTTTVIRHLITLFKQKYNLADIWLFGKSSHKETWLHNKFRYNNISKSKIDSIRKLNSSPQFKSNNTHQLIVLDDILA